MSFNFTNATVPDETDWFKLIVLGGALESARRFASTGLSSFLESFFITAELDSREQCFQWMMVWLANQSAWSKARTLQVSAPVYGQILNFPPPLPYGPPQRSEIYDAENAVRKLLYQPSYGKTCRIWYKGSFLQVTRSRQDHGGGGSQFTTDNLTIMMFTRNHEKLNFLLHEAYAAYKSKVENRINIFSSYEQFSGWTAVISRPKRSLKSVVLGGNIIERLLEDAKDFLASENWYAERGIPWRRGYLLHGSPGSGKTSLIHALAGELGLDIYVFSLAKRDMDDAMLSKIVSGLPPRSIALMEDIDVAFTQGVSRDAVPERRNAPAGLQAVANGVTLAGLLAAIDGVAAQEGRILFATTNDLAALDPALCRPGRLDVHFQFHLAQRQQAEELFKHFFPPHPENGAVPASSVTGDGAASLINLSAEVTVGLEKEKIYDCSSTSTKDVSLVLEPDYMQKLPLLSVEETNELATRFADLVPEGEFSMAALQGHLMQYKTRPHQVIIETPSWVEKERQNKRDWEEAKRKRMEARPSVTEDLGNHKGEAGFERD